MFNPYDLALRERAVTAYERGDGSYARLAALFDVDHRTLERWVARWRDTQPLAPQPRGGGWPCPIDVTVLRAVVRDGPDARVTELCWEYNRRVPRVRRTARSSFHRALRRAGSCSKTRPRPSEVDRPDVADKRATRTTSRPAESRRRSVSTKTRIPRASSEHRQGGRHARRKPQHGSGAPPELIDSSEPGHEVVPTGGHWGRSISRKHHQPNPR